MSPPLDAVAGAAPGPAPGRWLDSRAGQRLLAAGPFVALGLVLLMLWGVVAWFSIVYPQRLMDEYKRELASQTAAASAQTEAVLRDAEGNLRTLDLWLLTRSRGDPLNDASLIQLAETLRGTSRELVDVMLASADGRLFRLPAQPGQPFATLPEADFITLLASPEAEGSLLGAPLQLRAGGPIYLPLAMRMSAPVGELQSLVAMIDTRRLAELLRPYSRGDESAVALLRSDGLGLLRVPELAGFVGRDLFAEEPRRRQALAGASGSFVSSGAATDGLARLVSFETLDDFGVKVLLAQGLSATLGNHAEQRNLLLTLSAGISVAALLITLMLARMQRAARERDAALLATSNASPLGLFRCDAHGRIVYANDTYLRLHGFGAERQEWGWLEMVPEAERAQVRERWRERIGQGEAINAMRSLLRPDGQQRLFSVRTAPLRVNGRVVGAAGTVDDVTERVAQRQAELTLGAIFDRTPDYVCQFDTEGRLLYLNPAGRQRLGLAPDAALDGLDYRRFMRSSEPRGFLDTVPAEALQQGHWQGRSAVLDLQGREVPVASTVLVHRNERQQIATVSLLLRDISNQVQAQHERERSEAMLKAVAEAATTMIAVLDCDQCLLFFNRAFAQRFRIEREREHWLGRPLSELLGEADYGLSRPLIEAALAGRVAYLEKSYTDPPLVIELHYAPLQLESGEIEGVISIARDITEVRTEEARLRDASQTDPLTQLLNRSGFALRADEQLAHARQHNSLLTLLYLDLDRFKPVNDQHGHPVGDALLKAVAGRLRHALRPQDLVARLGGDEFAVLLPALPSAADAEAVAAKLLRAIAQPFSIEALELSIGVSIGYCVAAGGSADLDSMVAEADARLYEAKRAGRGCYRGGPATAAPPPA
ncbi:diguanylate cyclase domain-containing protein [Paucibacter sp. XJ19-41]|uniref:diguanylate cyclase domain-containing protein n=1 Tax=Paucibacter sp. XJ19-41 TaxID=2927824 RepID=UPI002349F2E8|nr:diguanylate cyclase [Paucibacter sp. XJ19-41]MDC6166502.1 diguanylate cyclase [Paucibacter sp. XJ19-41]